MPGSSRAQGAGDTRDDPSRIEQEFQRILRDQTLREGADTPVPGIGDAPLPASTEPIFTLTRIRIVGATVFTDEELSPAWRPYLGRMVSEADLGAITRTITLQYRDAGYPLSHAIFPAQDVDGGTVTLQVLEGYVAEVALADAEAGDFGVGRFAERIKAEQPLKLATLERNLLLINDTPGLRIKDTTLEELGGPTGRFRLTIYTETWSVWAQASLDNRGTREVGPLRATGVAAINSLFGSGDTISLGVQTVPDSPDELAFATASVEVPIGSDGLRLAIYGSHSEVRPDDIRRLVDTVTFSETLGARASMALYRSRAASVWIRANAQVRDAIERSDLGTAYHDRIRSAGLVADIRLNDDLGGENYLIAGVRQGFDILNASRDGDARLSRSNGSGEFTAFTLEFVRQQRLYGGLSLVAAVSGQMASGPLLASEEFAIGGPRFGRGYDGGEISGDEGWAGALELRFDGDVDWPVLDGYRLYAFVDTGTVWDNRPGSEVRTSLSSAGGGLMLFLPYGIEAAAEVGVPLTYRAISNSDRDPRIFFRIAKTFQFD